MSDSYGYLRAGLVIRKLNGNLNDQFEKNLRIDSGAGGGACTVYNLSLTSGGGFVVGARMAYNWETYNLANKAVLFGIAANCDLKTVSFLGGYTDRRDEATVTCLPIQMDDGGFTVATDSYTYVNSGSPYKPDWWIARTDANRHIAGFSGTQFTMSATDLGSIFTPTSNKRNGVHTTAFTDISSAVTAIDTNNPSLGSTLKWVIKYPATNEAPNAPLVSFQAAPEPITAYSDFNRDGQPDYVLFNPSNRQTKIWHLDSTQQLVNQPNGPTLSAGRTLVGTGDFNGDGKLDFLLYVPSTRQTLIWNMNDHVKTGSDVGPRLDAGWTVAAVADFNSDGKPDLLLFNAVTFETKIWHLDGAAFLSETVGPTVTAGWTVAGTADFNADAQPDLLLFNPSTRETAVWTMNDNDSAFVSELTGPTLPAGWTLPGAGDFNADGSPDLLLFNPSTSKTLIWHLKGATHVSGNYGATLPAGWNLDAH